MMHITMGSSMFAERWGADENKLEIKAVQPTKTGVAQNSDKSVSWLTYEVIDDIGDCSLQAVRRSQLILMALHNKSLESEPWDLNTARKTAAGEIGIIS